VHACIVVGHCPIDGGRNALCLQEWQCFVSQCAYAVDQQKQQQHQRELGELNSEGELQDRHHTTSAAGCVVLRGVCETVPGTGEVARFPVETLGTHKDGNTEQRGVCGGGD
jgi:hypothetical protein